MKAQMFPQTEWDKLPNNIRTEIRQRERRVQKSGRACRNSVFHGARFVHDSMNIPADTLAGDIQKWRDEMLALRIRREALMAEAADSVHASLAEDGISDDRRAYRADLEKRLRAELAGGQQLFPNEILQVMPNGERWLYNVALNTWRQQTP